MPRGPAGVVLRIQISAFARRTIARRPPNPMAVRRGDAEAAMDKSHEHELGERMRRQDRGPHGDGLNDIDMTHFSPMTATSPSGVIRMNRREGQLGLINRRVLSGTQF